MLDVKYFLFKFCVKCRKPPKYISFKLILWECCYINVIGRVKPTYETKIVSSSYN